MKIIYSHVLRGTVLAVGIIVLHAVTLVVGLV